jgi:hypothetical protein
MERIPMGSVPTGERRSPPSDTTVEPPRDSRKCRSGPEDLAGFESLTSRGLGWCWCQCTACWTPRSAVRAAGPLGKAPSMARRGARHPPQLTLFSGQIRALLIRARSVERPS